MSQVSIVDIPGNNPQIPTRFNANAGFAIPIGNVLELLGEVISAGSLPFQSVASGNTVTYQIQRGQAFASSDASKVGLVSFDSAQFDVDANGFVTLDASIIGVLSVSGTANRITSTGGTNPVIDIASNYVGQASITTLGTITTGVWNGTAVTVSFGGTGRTSLTNHGVLVGAGTSAITQLAAGSAGQILQSGGASADPAYSTATYPSTSGTSGNIISSDGTNFVSSSPSSLGSSLVLIQSQTASNSANLSFTTGITSTYDVYFVTLTNVVPATNGAGLLLTVSTDGGSSYLSANYQRGTWFSTYNSATISNSTGTTNLLGLTGGGTDNTSSIGISAEAYLYGLPSANYKFATCTGITVNAGNAVNFYSSGYQTTTSAVNAIKFAFNAGNIASGVITLYGVRKS